MSNRQHLIRATIYDKWGNVLARAINNYTKTHPVQARFAKQAGEPDRIYLHAEIAALTKLRKDDRPHRIFIERYKRDGSAGNAKPCTVCEAALKHWGIKKVEYTL